MTEYKPELHKGLVKHFLFWLSREAETDLLIAGDGSYSIGDHMALVSAVDKHTKIPRDKEGLITPDGAGNTGMGYVQGWRSGGYDVLTPKDLRPIICEALGLRDLGND